MIDPSDDFVQFIKEMTKEKTGKDISNQEAWEGANNLIGFFDLLLKIDMKLSRNREKLIGVLKQITCKKK